MNAEQPVPSPQPPPSAGGQDRFLLAIVTGTILLVVISVIVVFVAGRSRPSPPADPNSPSGLVQTYIEALRAGDAERARSLLSRDARTDSTPTNTRTAIARRSKTP